MFLTGKHKNNLEICFYSNNENKTKYKCTVSTNPTITCHVIILIKR